MSDFLEDKAERAESEGDLLTALQLWRELAIHHQDAVFFCRYGNTAKELARWDEAEAAFHQALRIDPCLSAAMECMGSLWVSRLDKERDESLRVARDWFLRALRYKRDARTLTFLGNVEAALDNEQAARPIFEQAISLDPNYEEALYNLASVEKHANNSEKAVSLLRRALEIDPDYALAHREIGILLHGEGNLKEAEYHLCRALELDPADYWAHMYLANLMGVQGRNVEAEQTYRLATTLHPELTEGIEFFARFLDSVGKAEEAADVRKQARRT